MSQPIQILIVEDNPADAELLVRELRRWEFNFEWERVDTEAGFLAKLEPGLHLILSDFVMPDFSGLRALELLKGQPDLDIPFIIVSGTIGEETAVEAMQQGAADYIMKDRIGRLNQAVRRALKEVEKRQEHARLQAQFIEAQKMEVVGHLAAGVAHDFNNVLAVIMGYSDLTAQELAPENPVQEYVQEIRDAAKRATGLTQQLLIFSRKQKVQAVVLNINEVIEDMEKMLRRLVDENIELIADYGQEVGQIEADAGYVWQVMMNLVVNARDAMFKGGKLTIETSTTFLDESYTKDHPDAKPGAYVVISVTDTGVGMTEETKASLFKAFFTTKASGKGTGLGLVTCQTIVRESGGHIDISSELGQGTTFKVYFPRVDPPLQKAASPMAKKEELSRGTETVLVVEDEPALRHLAQGVLKGQGYQVLTAPNGQDALRVVDKHQGEPIALVITDVVMPRMGGKAMAEWLQTTSPNLKILFTSGYTENSITESGVLENGIEFLPKPYTPASLARKVRELLDATS